MALKLPKLSATEWVGLAIVVVALVCVALVHHRTFPVLDPSPAPHPIGAFHVHSVDSHDSDVQLDVYLDAARMLGLDFIVLTDHNNQRPHAQTRDNVTVLSYAELSTALGHVVQLGTPYTLGSVERTSPHVLANIRATGGSPVITHPSDVKRPWSGSLENAGGLEIANVAASARRAAQPMFIGLLPQLAAWPLNRTAVMGSLYDRDDGALAMWDEQPNPGVVGICGTDAHGWIPPSVNLHTWYVALDVTLPEGDGRGAAILDALTSGRFHCVAALLGHDPDFAFNAWHGAEATAGAGDTITQDKADTLSVTAASASSGENQIVLLRNGAEISRTSGRTLRYPSPVPGSYRVEVHAPVPNLVIGSRWLPVIYSNRLRIVASPEPAPAPIPAPAPVPAQAPEPASVPVEAKPSIKHEGNRHELDAAAKKKDAKHDSKHEASKAEDAKHEGGKWAPKRGSKK